MVHKQFMDGHQSINHNLSGIYVQNKQKTFYFINFYILNFIFNITSLSFLDQNFLDNFPSSDILSFIARIFLLFQMMTVYPLLGYLARVQLLGHVFGDIYPR